jgi:UDP-2,3-diacylglucosamine pyrophosphatase LpxH
MARRGVDVTYIPGNHDAVHCAAWRDKPSAACDRLDAIHEGADGRRYRVSHGDEFDPEQIGRSWMLHLGEAMHRFICWSNRRVYACVAAWRCRTCRCRSSSSRISARHWRISALMKIASPPMPRARFRWPYLRAYPLRPGAQIDGVLYLNDGDWVEHCTALTEDHTGAMELIHWSEQPTALGRASRELVMPSPTAALARATGPHKRDARRPAPAA